MKTFFVKNYLAFICVVLIVLVPCIDIRLGVDVSDVGFSLNQYRFCFSDMGSIYLPILLTDVIGCGILKICALVNIPGYLGLKLAWSLSCYYLCFLAYRLYRKYRKDALILPALVFAELLARTNFNYFIYNTAVALFVFIGLYFLIRALADERPRLLFWTVLLFVGAALCKISALVVFGVFIVMFYDLFLKRRGKLFARQVLWCVAGLAAGLAASAAFAAATCGIGTYLHMVADMFGYAGSSNDGHTIGNMVMINVNGTLRGLEILLVLFVVCLVIRLVHLQKIAGWAFTVIAVLLLVGKLVGLDANVHLAKIYQWLNLYNALAILTALIYVCAVIIIFSRRYSPQMKIAAFSSGLITVLLPIGSNVGITHLCNEAFFVMPFIAIALKDQLDAKPVLSSLICGIKNRGMNHGRQGGERCKQDGVDLNQISANSMHQTSQVGDDHGMSDRRTDKGSMSQMRQDTGTKVGLENQAKADILYKNMSTDDNGSICSAQEPQDNGQLGKFADDACQDAIQHGNGKERRIASDGVKKLRKDIMGIFGKGPAALTVLIAVWMVILTVCESFRLSRLQWSSDEPWTAYQLDELRFMRADTDTVDELTAVTEFLRGCAGSDDALLVVGSAPILNYLSGIEPFLDGCGGWMETDYITPDEVAGQLAEAEKMPLIVMHDVAASSPENEAKVEIVTTYMEQNSYAQIYSGEEYSVYSANN